MLSKCIGVFPTLHCVIISKIHKDRDVWHAKIGKFLNLNNEAKCVLCATINIGKDRK